MYPISKVWILLELKHSHLYRQISVYLEKNCNYIHHKKPQTFTSEHLNIIPNLVNAFSIIFLVHQLTIISVATQIGKTLLANLL